MLNDDYDDVTQEPEANDEPWTRIEINLLADAAGVLREELARFAASGGLAGHRGHATPGQLARLDRMLMNLVVLATSILNDPDWLEPVGRTEVAIAECPRPRRI